MNGRGVAAAADRRRYRSGVAPTNPAAGTGATDLAALARRVDATLVPRTSRRSVDDVAFDDFAFETHALVVDRGTVLERGVDATGRVLAAAAVEWAAMPFGWTALQSRRGADLLGLDGGEPLGVARFDDAFALDAEQVETFREFVAPALLDWLVWLDDQSGPLVIVFDGVTDADRLRDPDVPAIYVARLVKGDDDFLATARLATRLADHLAAMIEPRED